ncbi:hypothetical protein [Lactobacillus plantarum subsp. plantarum ST-III] [Lactiplantibacillus mudanjiangensis]|uniref:hypothetical protein n=1 Tax=Lactiplantibacillus mudanjiangensis TaxID=1296538 RepID=UPI0010147BD5|nr:hypothetical protein [Lactobacillus plantarum subsp. plantarum ST-III] [Lactiplantibacillus mudanjiangensis]
MKNSDDLMRYTEMAMKGLVFDDELKQSFKTFTDTFLTCYEEAKAKGYSQAESMQVAAMIISSLFPNS